MSRREAPLYVRCHDLARCVTDRFDGSGSGLGRLGPRLVDAALDLLCQASLALTFRPSRSRDLADADRALVRLRVQLRVARDVGALSASGLRHLEGLTLEIGRMIGGWRKRVDSGARATNRAGGGPPPPGTA